MKARHESKTTKRQAARITQPSLKSGKGLKLEEFITINRSAGEVYSFWRRFENLPRFMVHLKSVTELGEGKSHWVMKTSKGKELEWDAQIIKERPGEMISWQSLEDADVDNAGSVWFTPVTGGDATIVRVQMKYSPPGGKIGAAIGKITGQAPEIELAEDLSRFKTLVESEPAEHPSI